MSYKTILLSKLLETDLLFDNMGPVAQRLEQACASLIIEISILYIMQGSESYSDKKIRCLYGLRVQVPSQVPSILKC